MALNLRPHSSLSTERKNHIAQAIAEQVIYDSFRFMSPGDYRSGLGNMAKEAGHGITPEELHEYILGTLPTLLGHMFGYRSCGISLNDKDERGE